MDNAKNLLVFLVDDDPDDQEIFWIALNKIALSVKSKSAMDGREALEMLESDTDFIPDIIFLDLNMPRLNGKDCLREIRKTDRLKNVPVYIYSTSSSEKDKQETMGLGATGFIVKPYTTAELTEALSKIFNKA